MDGSLAQDVDFYYTVRHAEEALFVDELQAAAQNNRYLKLHVRLSSTDGSLKVEEIVRNINGELDHCHVYLCGPLPMVEAFEKDFLGRGLPKQNIHYEEFNFR
jgi:predicted ferric reductase